MSDFVDKIITHIETHIIHVEFNCEMIDDCNNIVCLNISDIVVMFDIFDFI